MDRARKVRKILPVSPCDIRGLEAWLEEQANAGLFPVSIGSWAVFTTDGVPGTRFRLEPYDRGRTAPTEEQQELYRRAGWSYALNVPPPGAGCFTRRIPPPWSCTPTTKAGAFPWSGWSSRAPSLAAQPAAGGGPGCRIRVAAAVLERRHGGRGGLPLVWLRVFDPTFLVLLLCQGVAFGRSCRNAGLLRQPVRPCDRGWICRPPPDPAEGSCGKM